MLHFIITLEVPSKGFSTFSATYTPRPGMTRIDVFNDIYRWAMGLINVEHAWVVFFSLESNELAGSLATTA